MCRTIAIIYKSMNDLASIGEGSCMRIRNTLESECFLKQPRSLVGDEAIISSSCLRHRRRRRRHGPPPLPLPPVGGRRRPLLVLSSSSRSDLFRGRRGSSGGGGGGRVGLGERPQRRPSSRPSLARLEEYLKGVLVGGLQIGRNVPKLPPIRRDDFDVTQRLGRLLLRAKRG